MSRINISEHAPVSWRLRQHVGFRAADDECSNRERVGVKVCII